MEKRAPGAIDGADHARIERDQGLGSGLGVVRVEIGQTAPATPHTHHLMTFFGDTVHDSLDAGVETRDVTATGQDSDSHVALSPDMVAILVIPATARTPQGRKIAPEGETPALCFASIRPEP